MVCCSLRSPSILSIILYLGKQSKPYFVYEEARFVEVLAFHQVRVLAHFLCVFFFFPDEKFGLLSSTKMTDEFLQQGCSEHISKLIRSFLSQLSIIHQVNRDYCLVPSAINSDPALSHEETLGCFPRYECYQFENLYVDSIDRLPSVDPLVCVYI